MTSIQKMLLKISFIGTFAETMLSPIYLALANRFGGDIQDAGFGFCVFNITTGVLVFTFGQTDFFNKFKKLFVMIGFSLAGLTDLSYLLIYHRWQFYILQIIAGIAIGLANPAWDSIYEDEGEEDDASKWSFWTGGISFIVGIGAFISGYISKHYGLAPIFVIMGVTDSIAVYYSLKLLKTFKPSKSLTP